MTTAASGTNRGIESLRQQVKMVDTVLRLNVDGVTHEESLIQPSPGGNCLNWVVGHLVAIYENALPLLGQQPTMPKDAMKRYDRGSPPIQDASQARDFSELMTAWDQSSARFDAGLSALNTDIIDEPAPFSPTDDPDETVRSLLTTIFFHQTYHAGQTGVLRRIAGKNGAIR